MPCCPPPPMDTVGAREGVEVGEEDWVGVVRGVVEGCSEALALGVAEKHPLRVPVESVLGVEAELWEALREGVGREDMWELGVELLAPFKEGVRGGVREGALGVGDTPLLAERDPDPPSGEAVELDVEPPPAPPPPPPIRDALEKGVEVRVMEGERVLPPI